MQMVSSASLTCLRSRSAVECTATVLMPSSLQARRMRSAISPRLAMTTLSNMGIDPLFDNEQRLIEFNGIAVFNQDALDHASLVRLDLVHHLHGFDDAQRIANLDLLTHFHERRRVRTGRAVESADHGGAQNMTAQLGSGGRSEEHTSELQS